MEEPKEVQEVVTMVEPTSWEKKEPKWIFGKKEKMLTLLFSLLFLVMALISYFVALKNEEQTLAVYEKIATVMLENVDPDNNSITELNKEVPSDNLWQMQLSEAWDIFLNNLRVVTIVLVGGILTVYFYPTIALAINGAVMGMFLAASEIMNPTASVWETLLTGIAPHGIFEIPSIILACVMGSRFGLATYRKIFKKEQFTPYHVEFKRLLNYFLAVLLPLLIAAAYIEIFVTPYIMMGSMVMQTLYLGIVIIVGLLLISFSYYYKKIKHQMDNIERKIDAVKEQK